MKLLILSFSILYSYTLLAQQDVGHEAGETTYKLYRSNTNVKNPLELRDPFKRKISKKKSQQQPKNQSNGYFTNINESIENKSVESLKIVGIMIGAERRAMAQIAGEGSVLLVKEGMKIGPNGAEVKAILPGGIVLVEKIRNVYDQDEYLETVIPLSN